MTTAISPGVYMQPRGKEILCLCYEQQYASGTPDVVRTLWIHCSVERAIGG